MSTELTPAKSTPANPLRLVVCPRTLQSYGGELVPPGTEVEVVGERQVAHVGTAPDPDRFCWVAMYNSGGSTPDKVIASVGGRWYEAKDKAHATEVSGADAVRATWESQQADADAEAKKAKAPRK